MLIAPDRIIVLLLTILVAASVVSAWRSRALRRRWLLAGAVGVLALTLFAGRIVSQGTANSVDSSSAATLRIVSWNAQGVEPAEIANRVWSEMQKREVSVVVLPETGDAIAGMVSEQLDLLGWRHVMFEQGATSVLMDDELAQKGQYRLDEGNPPWAGIAVVPRHSNLDTPTLVAAHVQQPSIGNIQTRQSHLAWIQELCESDYVITVGDFNSTLNHFDQASLGRCVDVAAGLDAGATSTWPTWLPNWLGISIDRAMVSPPYDPNEFGFRVPYDFDTTGSAGWGDGAGSDHWPIVVGVPPPG